MRVLSVPEVTAYLKDLIDLDPILSDIWIRGEITNLSRSAAGHIYFCLVSEGIQINCVLFRGNQFGLLTTPRNGDAVLAHGRITIYESRGQYQLMVDNIAPEGMGILQIQFEEMKRRLEQEGLFALERKRPIPRLPRCIGVVTSAQGAVWHDIQNVVARRFPLVELILAPSSVQGPLAPAELIASLRHLQETGRCDVIIIARGGGSAEDLACFNDEQLARAIFGCTVPVVSAVGHETDSCIADLVADLRAPTPSAAAELCVPDGEEILAAVGHLVTLARSCTLQAVRDAREELVATIGTVQRFHPRSRIDRGRQDIDVAQERAIEAMRRRVNLQRALVETARLRATLLDPREVLRRGYAAVSATVDGKERRITTAADAQSAGTVTVAFSDGAIESQVTGRIDQ
jgi:exodeoxyribonuclease VII large subunit